MVLHPAWPSFVSRLAAYLRSIQSLELGTNIRAANILFVPYAYFTFFVASYTMSSLTAREQRGAASLTNLPTEICVSILSHLTEPATLIALAGTCHTWNELAAQRLYNLDAQGKPSRCIAWAIKNRRAEPIRRAVAIHANVFDNEQLFDAALAGDVNVVKALLGNERLRQHLISPEQPSTRRDLPLLGAIEGRNIAVLSVFLENGADINAGVGRSNALRAAFESFCDNAIVHLLLDYGVDMSNGELFGTAGALSLAMTSWLPRKDVLQRMLQLPRDVRYDTKALRSAARRGADYVSLLLEAGFDPNKEGDDGQTPLFIAAESSGPKVFELLIASGATVDERQDWEGRTLMHVAKYPEIVNILIQHGISVDVLSSDSKTPLLTAIQGWEPYIVAALLEHGADMNVECNGKRPIDYAVFYPEIIDVLVEHGADINSVNTGGKRPIHMLVDSSSKSKAYVLPHLHLLGANMQAMDRSENTILHLAAQYQDANVLKLCLGYGVDINSQNKLGYTPLMLACEANCAPGVVLLMENGADASCEIGKRGGLVKDVRNRTAYHIALRVRTNKPVLLALLDPTLRPEEKALYSSMRLGELRQRMAKYIEELYGDSVSSM